MTISLIQLCLNLSFAVKFVINCFLNKITVERLVEIAERYFYCCLDWDWTEYWLTEKVWLKDLIWIDESIYDADKSISFSFSFALKKNLSKNWILILNSLVANHSFSNSSNNDWNLNSHLWNSFISGCWVKYWFIIFLLLIYVCSLSFQIQSDIYFLCLVHSCYVFLWFCQWLSHISLLMNWLLILLTAAIILVQIKHLKLLLSVFNSFFLKLSNISRKQRFMASVQSVWDAWDLSDIYWKLLWRDIEHCISFNNSSNSNELFCNTVWELL